MKRSHYKYRSFKVKIFQMFQKNLSQRKLVAKINREVKLDHFHYTEISKSSKYIWNKCRPYFSKKYILAEIQVFYFIYLFFFSKKRSFFFFLPIIMIYIFVCTKRTKIIKYLLNHPLNCTTRFIIMALH